MNYSVILFITKADLNVIFKLAVPKIKFTKLICGHYILITNSDLNRPCFPWHPYGKLGLFKAELVIVCILPFVSIYLFV